MWRTAAVPRAAIGSSAYSSSGADRAAIGVATCRAYEKPRCRVLGVRREFGGFCPCAERSATATLKLMTRAPASMHSSIAAASSRGVALGMSSQRRSDSPKIGRISTVQSGNRRRGRVSLCRQDSGHKRTVQAGRLVGLRARRAQWTKHCAETVAGQIRMSHENRAIDDTDLHISVAPGALHQRGELGRSRLTGSVAEMSRLIALRSR